MPDDRRDVEVAYWDVPVRSGAGVRGDVRGRSRGARVPWVPKDDSRVVLLLRRCYVRGVCSGSVDVHHSHVRYCRDGSVEWAVPVCSVDSAP